MSFYTTPPEKLDVGYQCGDVEMELGFPRTKFARGMAWQGNALRAVTDWGQAQRSWRNRLQVCCKSLLPTKAPTKRMGPFG